ncbi:heparinase II/III family protein [Martelella radicis]|uniref:Putative heparinase superfamily protein n=1 Tax=Martelella radicis TaxID=1397476 RepID=A0A7W6KJR5_9HYPH|nr:heparinase II/III family protein [Martelella radicis]MBB4122536.1 putative heparinase superfamily protein [Martelella radicis]
MSLPVPEIWRYAFLFCREATVRAVGLLRTARPPLPRLLSGRRATRLLVAPTDLRIADPLEGEDLLEGRFTLAGDVLETGGRPPFSFDMPSLAFEQELAGFSWLRHLRTRRGEDANIFARAAVLSYMRRHRTARGPSWQTEIAVRRLNAWLCHSTVILKGADAAFYRRFIDQIARHERILRRRYAGLPRDAVRLQAAIALAMTAISLDLSDHRKREAARRLDDELEKQILPDGGHISRSPDALVILLLRLLPLRQTYINLDQTLPKRLVASIDRAYAALNFFRHRDGDLALFNGTGLVPGTALSALLRYDETGGAVFRALPHSGFDRLQAGRTTLIADTGRPLSVHLSKTAHAGALAFEMSAGQNRFIVNAGVPLAADERTIRMARITAAHSAVSVDDHSAMRFSRSDFLGPVAFGGIRRVTHERDTDENGHDRLTMRHDGYLARYGLMLERRLALSPDGTEITGIDGFRGKNGAMPAEGDKTVAIARFHLHPAIWTMQEDDDTIFMTAPDNESWLFSAPGCAPVLEDGVFFAASAGKTASRQIVIAWTIGDRPDIRWRLNRLS